MIVFESTYKKKFYTFMCLSVIVFFLLCNVGTQAQAPEFHLRKLTANMSWTSAVWVDENNALQGGAPGVDADVYIDADSLDGNTLQITQVTNQCHHLTLSDGGTPTPAFIQFQGSTLILTGGSAFPGVANLVLHPSFTITNTTGFSYFSFENVEGGEITTNDCSFPGLKIVSTDTLVSFNLNDSLYLDERLLLDGGKFVSNGNPISANEFRINGDVTKKRVLDITNSNVSIRGFLAQAVIIKNGSNSATVKVRGKGAKISFVNGGGIYVISQFSSTYGIDIELEYVDFQNNSTNGMNFYYSQNTSIKVDTVIGGAVFQLQNGQASSRFEIGYLDLSGTGSFEMSVVGTSVVPGIRSQIDTIVGISLCGAPQSITQVAAGSVFGKVWLSNSLTISNALVSNVNLDGGTLTVDGGFDAGGNTNVVFNAAAITDLYWIGGQAVDPTGWNQSLNWSSTDPAIITTLTACLPNAFTNVYFVEGYTEDTVFMPVSAVCRDILWESTVAPMTFINSSTVDQLIVTGSIQWSSTMNQSMVGDVYCYGEGIHTITSNTKSFGNNLYMDAKNGSYTLTDSLSLSGQNHNLRNRLVYYSGTFVTAGFPLSMQRFETNNFGNQQTLNIQNSNIYISPSSIQGGYTGVRFFNNGPINVLANNNTNWYFDSYEHPVESTEFTEFYSKSSKYYGNFIGTDIDKIELRGNMQFDNVSSVGDLTFSVVGIIIDSLFLPNQHITTVDGNGSLTVNTIVTNNGCNSSYQLRGNPLSTGGTLPFAITTSNVQTLYNTIIEDITINTGSNVVNGQLSGTTTGWSGGAVSYNQLYWTGEGGTSDWFDYNNWTTSIPGPGSNDDSNPGQCIPGAFTNVVFHSNSFPIIDTVDIFSTVSDAFCHDMTWLGGYSGGVKKLTGYIQNELNIFGSLTFDVGMDITGLSGDVRFSSLDAGETITSSGKRFNKAVYFDGIGSWMLLDSLSTQQNTGNFGVSLDKGSLNLNAQKLNTSRFVSRYSTIRSLNINNAEINCYGFPKYVNNRLYFDNWSVQGENLTLSSVGSVINIKSYVSGQKTSFNHRTTPATYNIVNFIDPSEGSGYGYVGGVDGLTFSKIHFDKTKNSNIYNDIETDSLFYYIGGTNIIGSDKTIKINDSLEANGTPCIQTIIKSSSSNPAYLCKNGAGILSATFVDLNNIHSASCSGFTSNYQAVINSSNINNSSTGWDYGPALTTLPGLGADVVLNCSEFPDTIDVSGFYPSSITTYSWNDGSTNDSLIITTAGTYGVDVTYAAGCVRSDDIILNVNDNLVANITPTSLLCNTDGSGTAVLTIIGESSVTDYTWDLSASGLGVLTNVSSTSQTGLDAGNYSLIVHDPNCVDTIDFTITEPTSLSGTVNVQDVLCNGGTSGEVTILGTGGVPVYQVSADGETSYLPDGNTFTGFGIGSYTFKIKDINGCTKDTMVNITEPTVLATSTLVTSDYNGTDVSCFGVSDGGAEATASGGVPGYTYLWNTGSDSSAIFAQPAGIYSVVVTDTNGCTSSQSVTLSEPSQLAVTLQSQFDYNGVEISCFGINDGGAEASVTGGTAGYTYLWNTGSDTSAITNLSAGNYSVTITDTNGCQVSDSIILSQPLELTNSIVSSPANCNVADGLATVNTSGGTANYNYSWGHDALEQTNVSSTVPSGTITVVVVDVNGCQDTINAVIGTFNQPTVELDSVAVLCKGDSSGAAEVVSVIGNGAFTHSWLNSSGASIGQTDSQATNLIAGTYIVETTDINGCVAYDTIIVPEPLTIVQASIDSIESPLCFGDNNAVVFGSGNGGTGSLSYLWNSSPSQITATLDSIGVGTYTLVVTDSNGCISSDTIIINEPPLLQATENIDNVNCFGMSDGNIIVFVSGGTPNYNYSWNTGENINQLFDITSGIYSVTITDTNGCEIIRSFGVTEPDALELDLISITEANCGKSNGIIDVQTTGGVSDYTYLWSTSSTEEDVSNATEGVNTVIVTDFNGCTYTLDIEMTCQLDILIPQFISPNGDGRNDYFQILGIENFPNNHISIFNRWGNEVFDKKGYDNSWDGTTSASMTISNGPLPAGTYYYVLDLEDEVMTGFIQLQR